VRGPKRLPEIANKIGGWVGQARRMTRVMRRQLEEELEVEDLNDLGDLNKIASPQIPKPSAAVKPEPANKSEPETEIEDEAIPDHIPNDDDSYSPLHADDDAEKPA
jgi:Sec-independent protein translocase protein TatA